MSIFVCSKTQPMVDGNGGGLDIPWVTFYPANMWYVGLKKDLESSKLLPIVNYWNQPIISNNIVNQVKIGTPLDFHFNQLPFDFIKTDSKLDDNEYEYHYNLLPKAFQNWLSQMNLIVDGTRQIFAKAAELNSHLEGKVTKQFQSWLEDSGGNLDIARLNTCQLGLPT
ncbi:hypothetical protein HDV02_002134 [Globomyces sp. JEL0801]|nr:hypothetical protein HDV02_002134 [Globomyces sp. JEL0801]